MTTRFHASDIEQAARILREGGTVAFPTETVYGLGVNALAPVAVAKIFVAKGRPSWDPLIVHVSNREMLDRVAIVTPQAEKLIQAFWPGPLTLLLERTESIPDAVTAGRPLVGVRMPSHPIALALIHAAGVPIAAPSANRFGRTSPTTADHVFEDLNDRIDAILDVGPATVGVESTVLDPNQHPMLIYRPGAITVDMLEEVAGAASIFRPSATQQENPESLPSPGVGIRHYAPRAKLILVASETELHTKEEQLATAGENIGVLLPTGWKAKRSTKAFPWADLKDKQALAQRLFAGLRDLDARGVSIILCPLPEANGVGVAIRDRLEKAARKE